MSMKTYEAISSTDMQIAVFAAEQLGNYAEDFGAEVKILVTDGTQEEVMTITGRADLFGTRMHVTRGETPLTFERCACVELISVTPEDSTDEDEDEDPDPSPKVTPTSSVTGEWGGLTIECGIITKIAPNWPEAFFPLEKKCCKCGKVDEEE